MSKHTIIGMAGHIDHGKTAVIKALTGIQTDNLKEEQIRGITIDIGFAYWKNDVTIIDVPGHERFIKNMVAGVSTIDLFIMVISADDGIMPQTIEHLEILKFFDVSRGIVALNKVDLVEQEWLDLMTEEIESFLEKYGFPNIPVIPVSAVSKKGIDELNSAIINSMSELSFTTIERPFRLNIDRSFSAKGFGNVVTGTILSSEIAVGDRLQLLPSGEEVRIRGLQVHQSDANKVHVGQRVALNLGGADPENLYRGAVLIEPDSLKLCKEIIAEVKPVSDLEFRVRRYMNIRVHIGTDEIKGSVNWFGEKEFNTGDLKYIILKLDRPAVAAPGDAVLLRSLSPVKTLAGGRVLQINPPKLKWSKNAWQKYVQGLGGNELYNIILTILRYHGYQTITLASLKGNLFWNIRIIEDALNRLIKSKKVLFFDYKNENHYILMEMLDTGINMLIDYIEEELRKNSFSKGLNQKEIVNLIKKLQFSKAFLYRALKLAVNRDLLFFDGESYSTKSLKDSKVVKVDQDRIVHYYLEARFSILSLEQLSNHLNIDYKVLRNLTQILAKSGELESIHGQFYVHKQHFDALIHFLKEYFSKNKELTIGEVRDFTGSSRKYIVPLMEYLDDKNFTNRSGDTRIRGAKLN